jgi:hypothetical protein
MTKASVAKRGLFSYYDYMKKIPLTRGKYALVDDDDFEWLSQWKWRCTFHGYAYRSPRVKGDRLKRLSIFMHREINKTPAGKQTDHIDGNRLNNIKSNLRSCSSAENGRNRKVNRNKRDGLPKGVYLHYTRKITGVKMYIARITTSKGVKINLGCYNSIQDAKSAYQKKAEEIYGEFAKW